MGLLFGLPNQLLLLAVAVGLAAMVVWAMAMEFSLFAFGQDLEEKFGATAVPVPYSAASSMHSTSTRP